MATLITCFDATVYCVCVLMHVVESVRRCRAKSCVDFFLAFEGLFV